MTDPSSTCGPRTSEDSPNVTSSPASVDGVTPSDSQDGLTRDPSGPGVAPVSHSHRQATGKAKLTHDISGQSSHDSSTPVDQPQSSGSRLHHRRSSVTKEKDSAYQRRYRRLHRAKDLIRHAKLRAKKKNLPFDLSEHLTELQARIDCGVCEVTGLPLCLDGGRTWDSPSLDRIAPAAGYLYENIRIVCHAMNGAMGDWGEQPVVDMVLALLGKRREASNDLSMRLGQNLQQRLEGRGSTLYKLTWKLLDTPSGHRYWQQRASGHRTSDSGSTGWPTPQDHDGSHGPRSDASQKKKSSACLQHRVKLVAGWATPTKDEAGGTVEGFLARKEALNGACGVSLTALNLQVQTISGQPVTGSPASTEHRGQLNPAHSRWLQGYPVEWCQAAIRAYRMLKPQQRRG